MYTLVTSSFAQSQNARSNVWFSLMYKYEANFKNQISGEMGYRTFDNIINPAYDTLANNTDRWLAIADVLTELKRNPGWYESCAEDVAHNQKMFELRTHEPVNRLLKELECLQ